MADKTQYKLGSDAATKRLADWQTEGSTDLGRELALARMMLEQSIAAGQTTLARDLLGSIATLSKSHQIQRKVAGELLERSAVRLIAAQMIEAFVDALVERNINDWELIIDEVASRIEATISTARNEPPRLE